MCGLTGFLCGRGVRLPRGPRELATGMAARLAHRGPDGAGAWSDDAAGVALGHRRLAIVDLSPEGHQPMASPSGRFVTVVQRRDLQLRRAARASWRPSAPRSGAHRTPRSCSPPSSRWGLEAALQPARRHVRLRPLGPRATRRCTWRATGSARSRSTTAASGGLAVRLRAQGAPRHPGFAGRGRPRRAGPLSALRLRSGAPLDLRAASASCRPAAFSRLAPAMGSTPASLRAADRLLVGADVAASGQAAPFAGTDDEATDELERPARATRCAGAWSPTCRSGRSSRAASTRRRSSP